MALRQQTMLSLTPQISCPSKTPCTGGSGSVCFSLASDATASPNLLTFSSLAMAYQSTSTFSSICSTNSGEKPFCLISCLILAGPCFFEHVYQSCALSVGYHPDNHTQPASTTPCRSFLCFPSSYSVSGPTHRMRNPALPVVTPRGHTVPVMS